jgi:hypothetical protein
MRAFLIALFVLVLAALGGDRLAHRLAADEAEQRLTAEGLREPQVAVEGFPFLPQLLSRSFGEVQVEAAALRRDGRLVRDVTATGLDVEGPRNGQVTVARLTAQGTVPYDEVLDEVGVPGLSLDHAGGDEVALAREVTVLGRTVSVSATGRVEVGGNRLRIVPTGFELAGGEPVDSGLRPLLVDRFSVTYPLRGLLDGLSVQRVTAAPEGFEVEISGDDVTLNR